MEKKICCHSETCSSNITWKLTGWNIEYAIVQLRPQNFVKNYLISTSILFLYIFTPLSPSRPRTHVSLPPHFIHSPAIPHLYKSARDKSVSLAPLPRKERPFLRPNALHHHHHHHHTVESIYASTPTYPSLVVGSSHAAYTCRRVQNI